MPHKPEDPSSIPTPIGGVGVGWALAVHAVIPAPGRQRQNDPWDFLVTPSGVIVEFQGQHVLKTKAEMSVAAHTFDPSMEKAE